MIQVDDETDAVTAEPNPSRLAQENRSSWTMLRPHPQPHRFDPQP